MRLQQPVAEAVDGRDPGRVELARQVVAVELQQPLADPAAQLAGRALGVGDHEDRVDVDAALADRAAEALDDHGRLAGPGARRDEDDALLLDRPELLAVRAVSDRAHDLFTRHVGQSSHQVGHEPPRGSCRTSPSRIRSTTPTACSCARSIPPQNVLLVDVVVLHEPLQPVLARLLAQQPARPRVAGQRAVDAAERLHPDQVAQDEHVERDLQVQLAVDLAGGRRAAGLVVDDDPARAERVAVDPVDLARDREAAELEPALQLGRGALGAERDLEAARHERRLRLGLAPDQLLEVAREALLELVALQLGQVEAHVRGERVGQALAQEDERVLERLGLRRGRRRSAWAGP